MMASIILLHIIGLINPKHWFLSLMGMENIFLIATMNYAENWLQRESWLLAMIIQDMEELGVMEFQFSFKIILKISKGYILGHVSILKNLLELKPVQVLAQPEGHIIFPLFKNA